MYKRALIITGSLVASCLAGPLDIRDHSSSTPWPTIPQPAEYSKPKGEIYVYPVSKVKGVTTEQDKQAELSFSSVGDIYTRTFDGNVSVHPGLHRAESSHLLCGPY